MSSSKITLRRATKNDFDEAMDIVYQTFSTEAAYYHSFTDFTTLEYTKECLTILLDERIAHGVVAEVTTSDNKKEIVGYNCITNYNMDCRTRGIGPVAVKVGWKGKGIGRVLMEGVIKIAKEDAKAHNVPIRVRLVQDCWNNVSFSLYASMGFRVLEPILEVTSKTALTRVMIQSLQAEYTELSKKFTVKDMTESDVKPCAELQERMTDIPRTVEVAYLLNNLVNRSDAFCWVVSDNVTGDVVGYTTGFALEFHSATTTEESLRLMILRALLPEVPQYDDKDQCPPKSHLCVMVLTRLYPNLLVWLLRSGAFVSTKQMNLMGLGDYREPSGGVYVPTIEF